MKTASFSNIYLFLGDETSKTNTDGMAHILKRRLNDNANRQTTACVLIL